ncbi:hypothetical protein [Hymenobacter sp. BT491]|uniref:hypothetical protein n=1 Tax=Hymenobacter sp. BT491 TaxID=2766779 RepID=UPI00165392D0|nr:hypothetical protein [Hymenobacter sp. BT491]MBC6988967.1 hypothetical protein [Hymenobacter sp. BT491]
MPTVRPYDPEALTVLKAFGEDEAKKLARLLHRKQERIEELRGKEDVSEADYKAVQAIEREIETIVAFAQAYKQIFDQYESESESRWAMIQLQDQRCRALKQKADEAERQAKQWAKQFEDLAETFQQYVRRGIDQQNKAA